MENSKRSELYDDSDGLGILTVVLPLPREVDTVRVNCASTSKRPFNDLLRSCDYPDIYSTERDPISGRHNGVLSILVQCAIGGAEEFSYSGIRFYAWPVVNEVLDRDLSSQLLHRAVMVSMPVCRDQVIDLVDTSVAHCAYDSTSIPSRPLSTVSGVDQKCLACRGHEQRRTSTLNINQVNLKSLRACFDRRDA